MNNEGMMTHWFLDYTTPGLVPPGIASRCELSQGALLVQCLSPNPAVFHGTQTVC